MENTTLNNMENTTPNNIVQEPRGYRNNNPLNIRHGKSQWAGMRKTQTDSEFVQFESIEMGYRAAALVLLNYIFRYKRRTVRQIIARWAPKSENNTNVYLYHVCEWMCVRNPDHVVDINELPSLLAAMSRQETGRVADRRQVQSGYELAMSVWRGRN